MNEDDYGLIQRMQQVIENTKETYEISYDDLNRLVELAWQYIDLNDGIL